MNFLILINTYVLWNDNFWNNLVQVLLCNLSGTGDCTWSDLKVTNSEEVTLTHKFLFTFSVPRVLRQPSVTFPTVEEEVIVESMLHVRKASMAMNYSGPMASVQSAMDLFYNVALEGRDEMIVKPTNTETPVDLTFSSVKLQKIKSSCTRFPSSVRNSFC